jgi:hypothetical protein
MLQKLGVALISSIFFCFILTAWQYIPMSERQPNTYYFSFSELMIIYLLYATPVYLLGGIPSSIIIDKINQRKIFSSVIKVYFFNISLYALAGIITGFLFLIIISKGQIFSEAFHIGPFLVISAIASLLFFHVSIVIKKLANKILQ